MLDPRVTTRSRAARGVALACLALLAAARAGAQAEADLEPRAPQQTFDSIRIEALGPSLELYSTLNSSPQGGGPPTGYFVGFNSYAFSVCQRSQPYCDFMIRRADVSDRYAYLRAPLYVSPYTPISGSGLPTFTVAGGPETRFEVRTVNSPVAGRNLMRLINNGPSTFRFDNGDTGTSWAFGSIVAGDRFFIGQSGQPGLSLTLDGAGNLTLLGLLTQMSDRNSKRDVVPADGDALLARVAALPVATWSYKADSSGARHIGPMAQDFSAAFGLGADPTHLAPSDVAGVTLAALQALERRLHERDLQLAALQTRLEALEQARPSEP